MKPIPLKDGTDGHIDPTWVSEWCEVYWKDDVYVEIEKCRLWALDNPQKRKTKRGLRAFLGNWIRRSCRLRPKARMIRPGPVEERPKVDHSGFVSQMKAKLRKQEAT